MLPLIHWKGLIHIYFIIKCIAHFYALFFCKLFYNLIYILTLNCTLRKCAQTSLEFELDHVLEILGDIWAGRAIIIILCTIIIIMKWQLNFFEIAYSNDNFSIFGTLTYNCIIYVFIYFLYLLNPAQRRGLVPIWAIIGLYRSAVHHSTTQTR